MELESQKLKKHFLIAFFVILALAAVCFVVGFVTELGLLGFFAFILIITSVIVGIIGLVKVNNAKKFEKNTNNPNSLASKTYGGKGNYAHFYANLDRKAQAAKNAAINAFGLLGMLFGGGGVFVSGQDAFDVFVSSEEILINNKNKNSICEDSKFMRIHSSNIKEIKFESLKAYERVILSFTKDFDNMVIDIIAKKGEDRTPIHSAFNNLLNKTEE